MRSKSCFTCLLAGCLIMVGLAVPVRGAVSYTAVELFQPSYDWAQANGISGSQVVGQGSYSYSSGSRAVMWSGNKMFWLPGSFSHYSTTAVATDGIQQVGYATNNGDDRALLWRGTAAPVTDLHPASGYTESRAMGVGGGLQAGFGVDETTQQRHALVWAGTAANVRDVHPSGYTSSEINALTPDGQMAGGGPFGKLHALHWASPEVAPVDLNPAWCSSSTARAIHGNQQAGYGTSAGSGKLHALLWSGSAESAVDLNPAGYGKSQVFGMNAQQQVGMAWNDTGGTLYVQTHAFAWSGTAASGIDLHQFLPTTYLASKAMGIDAEGRIVGYAMPASHEMRAVMWIPNPEPTTLALLAMGGFLIGYRRVR
jgi:hypothetical protein